MGLYKTFQLYKRVLVSLFVVNVLLVVCGVVAGIQYFNTHDVTLITFVVIGIGTLVFGFIAPFLIIKKLTQVMDDMRQEAERAVARLITGWMENFRKSDDPLRDPQFWLNVVILLIDIFGPQFQHPMMKIMTDFTPLMKVEMNRMEPKNNGRAASKKTSTKKNGN